MRRTNAHPQDIRALAVGASLIVLVGIIFISRTLFFDADPSETQETATNTANENAPTVSPEDLQNRLSQLENIILVDTRPQAEYAIEHLPRSRSFPDTTLETFAPESNHPVVIITSNQDQSSSELARQILATKLYSYSFLEGGIEAWKSKNFPTISQGNPGSFVDQGKITFLTPEEAKAFLVPENNVFILDVQTPERFASKHLVGAKNIPLAELEQRSGEVPSGRQILVYGENELISFQAGVRLFDLNFFAVRTLSGNLPLSSGLPVEP